MKVTDIFSQAEDTGTPIPIGIFIDREANWFYQGRPIIREDILELFYQNLALGEDDSFVVAWQGQRYLLDVEDSPFVITRVDRKTREPASSCFQLRLKHLKDPEILAPQTLRVGAHNVLYCRIQDGRFPARFSRPAYYQMAAWIDQDPAGERFFVELNGVRHTIQQ